MTGHAKRWPLAAAIGAVVGAALCFAAQPLMALASSRTRSPAPASSSLGQSAPELTAAPATVHAPPDRLPRRFHVVSMRGSAMSPFIDGNSIEALRAAKQQGLPDVEVDVLLTSDGVLVTAHDDNPRACRTLSLATLEQAKACELMGGRHVATLDEVLELEFETVFVDLKNTKDGAAASTAAVRSAVNAVVRAGAQDRAVLMLYAPTPASLAVLERHELRAGLKGYPESAAAARALARQAFALGFELVCVNSRQVTPELIREAGALGVWYLPWSTELDVRHWAELAANGAGGLIVLHAGQAFTRVAPEWTDVRARL
ncbi:MAG TPA: glycerophosphodiester phosphodiesterase family protein [Polyangiaceae bacterium]|jgi:glycerophosphoryl diester phosphodiesterase